jgi:hypothetical protein
MRPAGLATITLTAIGLGLASPTGAPAAVTIGSNLQNPPNQTFNCSGMNLCTVNLSALPAARQALGGLVAPINGVVVAWTIRIGASTEPVSFRAIRPVGGSFTGVATLPAVTPPISSTTSYSARVPVMAGDGIGLNCCQGGNGQLLNDAGAPNGSTFRYWNPVLGDGAGPFPPTATQTPAQYELTLQATIELDTDKDVFGDETQDNCLGTPGPYGGCPNSFTLGKPKALKKGKVAVTATLPGPGTVSAGSPSDPTLATKAARSKRLLRPASLSRSEKSAGAVKLILKLTGAARSRLADAGKLKLKIRAVYTPPGGSPGLATKKLKLRT